MNIRIFNKKYHIVPFKPLWIAGVITGGLLVGAGFWSWSVLAYMLGKAVTL